MTSFDKIYNAAKDKKFDLIQTILHQEGVSIDVRTKFLLTPAGILASEGEFEIVKELQKRFQINIHKLALGAAIGGHIDRAMKLKDQGANINKIAYGAALGGHFEFALKLKEQGANINYIAQGAALGGHFEFALNLKEQSANINNIAYGAALGGHFEFALKLKEQGADINKIAYGAALGGHFEFALKLKEQGANINYITQGAALGGHFEFALKLKEQGADINKIAYGAALGGHFEFVLKLKEQGADINYITQSAALGGHFEFVLKLKEQGADINKIAYFAALGGYISNPKGAFQVLLNIENTENRKALIQSLKNCDKVEASVKKELSNIDKKIDNIYKFKSEYSLDNQQALFLQVRPEIRSFMIQCYTPLTRGNFKVHEEFIVNGKFQGEDKHGELIKSPSAIPEEIFLHICLFLAPAFMKANTIKDLLFKLQQKALVRALDHYTNPHKQGLFRGLFIKRAESFKAAVLRTKNLDNMSRLVYHQHGLFSGINKYNKKGMTPLFIAVVDGSLEKVELLLEKGANPDLPCTDKKRTPLAIAVLNGRVDIIEALLKHYAQTDIEDLEGNTPYHLASQNNLDQQVLEALSSAPVLTNIRPHEKPLAENKYVKDDDYYLALNQSRARIT